MSKSTTLHSEKTNCLPDASTNFCSEFLLGLSSEKKNSSAAESTCNLTPKNLKLEPEDENASPCLSAEMLSEFVAEEDNQPDMTALEIPDETYTDLHHRSSETRDAVNSLATKNGVFQMASLLARKFP